MATYSAKGGKEFAKVSAGTHLAVCTLVADVGLQPGSPKFPDPKVRIFFRFEIPSERITYEKDGVEKEGPAVIYHNYTASMNAKSNMRKGIESWRGKKFTDPEAELFDVRKLLGQPCLVQVVHTDDGQYANVANIMAPPKGTPKVKPEGTLVYYGPDDDGQYNDLPAFLRKKVDEQLDPITQSARTPTNANQGGNANSGSAKVRQSSGTSDAEADAIAAQQAAKGTDGFEDEEIPFS